MWRDHRRRWGRFWLCRHWANSRWESEHTWQRRSQQPHWLWRTKGLQGGFQGRRKWWTSQAPLQQFQARKGLSQAVGQELKWGKSSISMRVKLAFQTCSQGKHNRQSCRWRRLGKTEFESHHPLAFLLSHAEPCDSNCLSMKAQRTERMVGGAYNHHLRLCTIPNWWPSTNGNFENFGSSVPLFGNADNRQIILMVHHWFGVCWKELFQFPKSSIRDLTLGLVWSNSNSTWGEFRLSFLIFKSFGLDLSQNSNNLNLTINHLLFYHFDI